MEAARPRRRTYRRRNSSLVMNRLVQSTHTTTPSTGTDIHLLREVPKKLKHVLSTEATPAAEPQLNALLAQIRRITTFAAVTAVLECVLVYLDMKYTLRDDFDESVSDAIRLCSLLASILLVACVLSFHLLRLQTLHVNGQIYAPVPLLAMWDSSEVRWFVIAEVALCLAFSPPAIHSKFHFYQLGTENTLTVIEMVLPLIILRLYHLFRCLYYLSSLNDSHARFYLKLHKLEQTVLFVFRNYLEKYSLLTCGLVALTNFFIMSNLINVHEHSVPHSKLDVWASLWLGANTQAGIGYGDVVPQTHVGRGCCVLLPMIGLFSMSTMMGNLQKLLNVSTEHKSAILKIWDSLVVRKRLEDISVILIQRRWRLHSNRMKRIFDIHVRMHYISHLLKFRRYFGVILNEEILLETMVQDLGASFSERYQTVEPMVSTANEFAQMTEGLAQKEIANYKRASKLQHEISKKALTLWPTPTPRASLSEFQTLSTREPRRSTRKTKMIITQRFSSMQDLESPEEPISGSLFRKRRR